MDERDPSGLTITICVDLLRATAFHLHLHNLISHLGSQGLFLQHTGLHVGRKQPGVAVRKGGEKARTKHTSQESTDAFRITSGREVDGARKINYTTISMQESSLFLFWDTSRALSHS